MAVGARGADPRTGSRLLPPGRSTLSCERSLPPSIGPKLSLRACPLPQIGDSIHRAFHGSGCPRFMPAISQFFGIVIQMFWREHAPPRFHALYAEHEALIGTRTLEAIGGSLPKRALSLTIEWAIDREELMGDWKLCQSKQAPKSISSGKRAWRWGS
jgi:hypothetical protein